MKIPNWAVPVLLRFLSLSGLTSAGTGDKALTIGLSLSSQGPATFPTNVSQPRPPSLSLELDFFIQLANHEFKVPIMPLHLLGKKSWNVYNADNIAKVKRDEAAAKAAEEAEEQRMQKADAERRMQILRGEIPTPSAIEEAPTESNSARKRERGGYGSGRERKRRKRAGENDTDFEMRVAREDQDGIADINKQLVLRKDTGVPLVDHKGHIDLFPQEHSSGRPEKNAEAEKEAAKKKKEYEDQYMMKFSNAAGFKQSLDAPWYSKSTSSKEIIEENQPGKDVWGNEDPRRKEREIARMVSSDPLAMMKAGAKQARQVKQERERWRLEKEREIRELEEAEAVRKRNKRKYDDDEDLQSFRLDDEKERPRIEREASSSRRHRNSSRERRHHRKESRRSSHREEDRHRHRHRHRHSD